MVQPTEIPVQVTHPASSRGTLFKSDGMVVASFEGDPGLAAFSEWPTRLSISFLITTKS
jgi:hypothetical protein